ncbi:hypothetical protein [Sorangium sp. So ce204]|uniref:hypothetical protein n=1 Tax=Sorangium sp. So ce204 TaxID=3133288 RepID=UPI003F63F5CF
MSDPISAAVGYLDRRLSTMKRAPGTWGSPESLELQALLLIELRTFLLRRRTHAKNPFEVRDAYIRFIHARFPDRPGYLLSALLPADDVQVDLPPLLEEFRRQIVEKLLREDPFAMNELVLDLVLGGRKGEGRFAAACRYFCRFERALRAFLRTGASGRRNTRGILPEPEVQVLRDDGGATRVRILINGLDRGGGEPVAREALGALLATLARLEKKAEQPPAAHDRSLVAAARRLLPRSGLQSICIGGVMTGTAPLVLQASGDRREPALPDWAALSAMDPQLPPRLSPAPPEAFR